MIAISQINSKYHAGSNRKSTPLKNILVEVDLDVLPRVTQFIVCVARRMRVALLRGVDLQ